MVAPAPASDGQRLGDGLLAVQVDAGVGLVEHEQLGLAGQRARDQHPLLLATGQGRDRVPARSLEARRPPGPARRPRGRCAGPAGTACAGTGGRPRRPRSPSTEPPVRSGSAAARSRAGATRGSSTSGWSNRRIAPALSGCRPTIALTRVDFPSRWRPAAATTSPACDGQVDVADDRPPAEGDAGPARRSTTWGAAVTVQPRPLGARRRSSASGSGSRRRCPWRGPRAGRARRCGRRASLARVSATSGLASVSLKTVVIPSLRDQVGELGEAAWPTARRRGSRPAIGVHGQTVAPSEVLEGIVADDERADLAVGQAGAGLLVEGRQVLHQPGGVATVVRGMVRIGLLHGLAERRRPSSPAASGRARSAGPRPPSPWRRSTTEAASTACFGASLLIASSTAGGSPFS